MAGSFNSNQPAFPATQNPYVPLSKSAKVYERRSSISSALVSYFGSRTTELKRSAFSTASSLGRKHSLMWAFSAPILSRYPTTRIACPWWAVKRLTGSPVECETIFTLLSGKTGQSSEFVIDGSRALKRVTSETTIM